VVSLFTLLTGGLLAGGASPVVGAQAGPTPMPLYALPDARTNPVSTSGTIARSDILRLLTIVNPLGNSVSLVAPVARELRAQIPVGADPRSVSITPDGVRAVVANRADASLSIVDMQSSTVTGTIQLNGPWAAGVVAATDTTAYVTLQGRDEVVLVDLTTGDVTAQIPTPPYPTGLALWGDFLYVTHLWSGDLSLIYTPQNRVVQTISTGADSGLSPSIDIDPTRGIAYLPQTRANSTDPALTYDTTVFPVVNVVGLDGLTLRRFSRLTPDTAARPVNLPYAIEIDPFRGWAYLANAGSSDVTVMEIATGTALAHLDVGTNPRGLLLNADNSQLYVHNAIDATMSFVDTGELRVIDTLPINPAINIPVDILIGAELFYSARDPRLAQDRWISCANCHLDGMTDGRVWAGFPSGPRNTPTLFDLLSTAPYNWDGSWDELADSELKIRGLQAGLGLVDGPVNEPLGDPHAGLSLDLDTMVIYLTTLEGPASPFPQGGEDVQSGEQIFTEQNCAECHAAPLGTDTMAYDVGTGGTFDTPSLRWLWMSAPYFHDGSAATLRDVFILPGAHQLTMDLEADEIDALVAYLLTLPADEKFTE